MASKPPVAVYDACVLYPFHLRNVLIQCAFDGLVEARWTDDINDEWIRNLAANTPALPIERLIATRDRMKAVLPDADVADYHHLISELRLPDPDDRHVLAAAIAGKAAYIVTWNLKDFPAKDLASHRVTSQSPDAFLTDLHAAFPDALIWGRNKSSSKSYAKVERIVNPRREILAHILLLFVAERRRAAERLSFQLGSLETGLRSLNQQTALELGDGIEHVHVHRAGGVGEIGAAERDTVDLYAHFSQCFDRGADVDRVAAEPIKLGHDQYVT
jgi:predicted nucleic acid-binding protein